MQYGIDTVAGDTEVATLALVEDETGEPVSLASLASARWWAAPTAETPVADVPLAKALGSGLAVLGDPGDGKLRLTLDAGDTDGLSGVFHNEVEAVFDDGTRKTAVYLPMRIRPGLVRD